ncbi:MAG: S1C family serine protease [Burkholderiales bacterium]
MIPRLSVLQIYAVLCSVLAAAVSGQAQAMDPAQVFEKVSPSVWVVQTFDAAGRPYGQGSAVVVAHGELVTNCHVLARAKYVRVRRKNILYDATLEHADVWRDLCLLKVENFDVPPVAIRLKADLKVGEHVFAIGNPDGFETTLSDGLISGLRPVHGKFAAHGVDELIQITAPTSPGSSGGGLFDSEARLVGITTLGSVFILQNVNFAVPAEWIAQIPARAKAALAKRGSTTKFASVGAPGLPAAGTSWTYKFVEEIYSRQEMDVTIRVQNVDDRVVEEQVTSSAPGAQDMHRVVNAGDSRFLVFPLDSNDSLIEMSPYLLAATDGKTLASVSPPEGYPSGGSGYPGFVATVTEEGWEQVTVPAGTFRALRVTVVGHRSTSFHMRASVTGKFEMTIWYAPEVKRFVKIVQKIWSADGFAQSLTAKDVIELRAYHSPS